MAAKKTASRVKAKANPAPLEGDLMPASYVGAILEEVRSHVRLLGEGMQGFRESMDRQLREFRADVDRRFDEVDIRFARVETRLTGVETRLTGVETDMALVKSAVLDVAHEVRGQSGRLKRLEDAAE